MNTDFSFSFGLVIKEFVEFVVLVMDAFAGVYEMFFSNIFGIVLFAILIVIAYFIFRWVFCCWQARKEIFRIRDFSITKSKQDFAKFRTSIEELMDSVLDKLIKESDVYFAFELGRVKDSYKAYLKQRLSLGLNFLGKSVTKCCVAKETERIIDLRRISLLSEYIDSFWKKLRRLQKAIEPQEIKALSNEVENNLVKIEKIILGGADSFLVEQEKKQETRKQRLKKQASA